MPIDLTPSSDIAFSPTLKAIQTAKGSRFIDETGQWATTITPFSNACSQPLRGNGGFVFDVAVWSANCPQHIPQWFDAADVQAALADKDNRISELETDLAARRQMQRLFDDCRDG
jgi:hypothetical protein